MKFGSSLRNSAFMHIRTDSTKVAYKKKIWPAKPGG